MLPLVGAVIGWVTNYIAIRMLFRPYRPVRIFGLTVQGLLPRRRSEFAASIARIVEKDLLTPEDITQFFDEVQWEEEVERAVDQTLEDKMKKRRIFRLPVVGVIGHEVVRQVKKNITRTIIKKVRENKKRLFEKFEDAIELKEVVSRKVEGFDMGKLESILMDLISTELAYIELIGALLGFIIGLTQMGILVFI